MPKRQGVDGVAVDVGFSGGSAAPRSSVNNCTRDPAAGADGLEHADHEVSETVNFDALSRQEKRELAQRLKEDLKRTRKKLSHQRQEGSGLSIKEKHIHELLSLRGVDASAAMLRSLIAGSSLACGDQVMSVSNGKLKSSSRAGTGIGMLPTQVKEIKDKTVELINRWKRVLTVCSSKLTG